MDRGTTTVTAPGMQLLRLGLALLVVLSGLCTIFVGVVMAVQAWQEHEQARWPEVMARIERCELARSSTGRRQMYYIHCRLSYAAGEGRNVANMYSTRAPSREVWQYPPNQIQPFVDWVNEHPAGTTITVRYDPRNPRKVVQAGDYMPRGGPRTPSNGKLLLFFAGSFVVLLAIARVTRPRSRSLRMGTVLN